MFARKTTFLALTALLLIGALSLPASGAEKDAGSGPAWTIHFYPSVRWGTNDRTVYLFDFLIPFYQGDKNILFFNPRFNVDNRDGSEVGFGFGYRHLLFSDKVILGINGYYDSRHTGWDTRHEQIGLGAEVMMELNKHVALTGRFNYYFPQTDPQIEGTIGVDGGIGYRFQEDGIYTGGLGWSVEETLEGFDAELGFRIPFVSDYVETWAYGGGYHYTSRYCPDIDGWSARLEVIPSNFLRLNYEYRNDNINHDEHYGEVSVAIPFAVDNLFRGKNPFEGFGKLFAGSRSMKERLVEPVRRDVDIIIDRTGAGELGPGTQMLGVVFVDEEGNAAGDGTFEHPFASIAEAATAMGPGGAYSGYNTIHVINSGAGTAGGGTADLANLIIWGSGMSHPVYPVIKNQNIGNPDVDLLTISGGGTEVFGASFVNATGMIIGADSYIHDNSFLGNAGYGINVAGGTSTITRNMFDGVNIGIVALSGSAGTATVDDNDFFGGNYGLDIAGGAFTITNNTIGTASNPLAVAGMRIGSGGFADFITGNNIYVSGSDNNVAGILFNNLTISGVSISLNDITVGNTGSGYTYGIAALSNGSDSYTLAITDNDIRIPTSGNDTTGGIYITTGGGDITATISGNDMSDGINGSAGGTSAFGIYVSSDTGSIVASLTDNDIKLTNAGSGTTGGIYLLTNTDTGGITAGITGNDMSYGITGGSGNFSTFGIFMKTETGLIDGYGVENNLITATSPNWDVAGIFAIADDIDNATVFSPGATTLTAGAGRNAYTLIDAEIVDNILELNSRIEDTGGNGWIYAKGGDYTLSAVLGVSPLNRSVSIWGEGYDMFDMGSAGGFPVLHSALTINSPNVEIVGIEINISALQSLLLDEPSAIRLMPGSGGNGIVIRRNSITISNAATSSGILDTSGISTYGNWTGIDLGSAGNPVKILNNSITVASSLGDAVGVNFWSNDWMGTNNRRPGNIYVDIAGNGFEVSGLTNACAAYLATASTSSGVIVGTFTGNSGTIQDTFGSIFNPYGNANRREYIVVTYPGSPGSSSLTVSGLGNFSIPSPSGAPWNGNYPAANGPIWNRASSSGYITVNP